MSSDAPGWSAIDAHLATLYPDVTPQHFGTVIGYRLGGPDPLDGLSFYPRTDPVPHWHAVTYGLSELYDKEAPDPEVSGWGFELTFRVARDAGDTEAPMWAATLLQNLARYVFSSGNVLRPGDHMDANSPLNLDHGTTALTALAFLEDPELDAVTTPNGTVRFVQAVGLTADELAAARGWDTAGVLGLLAERDPLLVTDLDRASITADPAVRAAIDAGTERDGSSTGQLLITGLEVTVSGTDVRLRIPEQHADAVAQAARDRFPYARPLVLTTRTGGVRLAGGPAYAARQVAGGVEVDLTMPAILALTQPLAAGVHEIPGTGTLTVEIAPE